MSEKVKSERHVNAGKLGGRPRKFTDAESMKKIGMEYIVRRRKEKRPLLVTGLALALDMDRDTLLKYEQGQYDSHSNCYSGIVKKLKAEVANEWEERIAGRFPTGAIFWLKNAGWSDQVAIQATGELKIKLEGDLADYGK